METHFKIGLMKSEPGYVLTKCSKMLKSITAILRFGYVTIKCTLKLSFRFEIHKLNVTITSICTSVLLVAFIIKSVTLQPRKDSNKSILMSLTCFLANYYRSDLS